MFAARRRPGSAEPQSDDDVNPSLINNVPEEQLLTPEAYSKHSKTNNSRSSNLRRFLQAATCIMFMYLVLTTCVYYQTQPAQQGRAAAGTVASMTSMSSHQNKATPASKHGMRHNRITSEIHVQNSKAVSPVVCILGNAQVRTLVLDSVDAGRHRRRSAEGECDLLVMKLFVTTVTGGN